MSCTENQSSSIGSSGYKFRDRVLEAIASTKRVKLYFPSEFGVNHTTHTFSQPEWDHKQHHMELASNLLKDVRICQVYNGLFLEDSIGPWFGFDTKNGIYEIAGSRDARVTFTSLEDVGKAVATLASTWKDLDKIPRTVQLAGDTLTINDIAELMKKEGAGEVEVKEIDGPAYEKKILALTNTLSPEKHLRFLLGKGAIDYSNETGTKNDNEVVNSGERDWKWKTMADYARETNGKPWADSEWKEDV